MEYNEYHIYYLFGFAFYISAILLLLKKDAQNAIKRPQP